MSTVLLSDPVTQTRCDSPSSSSHPGPRPLHLRIDTSASVRSPVSPGMRTSFMPTPGLKRTSSITYNSGKTSSTRSRTRPRSLQINPRASEKENGIAQPRKSPTAKDRGPLTLAEKHADLLQFIAQKESKCLELRSQLANHEAELLQLKRKWEKIVTRGLAYGQNTPSSTVSSPASSSPRADYNANLNSNNGQNSNPAIIDNIQKGVQGAARLLAQGLERSSTTNNSIPTPPHTAPLARTALPMHSREPSRSGVGSFASRSKHTSASSVATARLSQSSFSSSSTAATEWEEETSAPEKPDVSANANQNTMRGNDLWALLDSGNNASHSNAETAPRPKHNRKNSKDEKMSRMGAGPSTLADPSRRNSRQDVLGALVGPAWAESVGRKWDNTFAKSQRRASGILSDVSQSVLAALSGPSGTGVTSEQPRAAPAGLASRAPLSSSPQGLAWSASTQPARKMTFASVPPPAPAPRPTPASIPASGSLLDDDDGGLDGLMAQVMTPDSSMSVSAFGSTAVMSPIAGSSKVTRRTSMKSAGGGSGMRKEEDEWNW